MYFYKNKIAHIENIFKWGLKQYFFKYQYHFYFQHIN